ncbi:hypothetical protein [Anianabacter salinae]|uniref:hypothetical protein n=1 Tax=Anianabacter salinae TaxID=2851023 RepID=UPI00225E1998|nr:hypothetical protein [Anianabacter salinae]MBV0912361.1 hypothetical protein [Anianabacter salinae]
MANLRSRLWGLAALALIYAAAPGHAARLTVADLADAFPACALLHLTEDGYPGLRGRSERPPIVTRLSLRAYADAALHRPPVLHLRNSLPLHWSGASSIEAERVYRRLERLMQDKGFAANEGYRFADVAAMARAAYALRAARDGVGRCVTIKWGNKQPDLFFAPLPASELQRIRGLFSDTAFARFRAEFAGRRWPLGLSDREAFEVQALRLASFRFELNFEMLDRDRGDFAGNTQGIVGGTVCTDEAAIQEGFLRQVILADGLLTRFRLKAPAQFAQRRPQTRHGGALGAALRRINDVYELTDHFAPVLVGTQRPVTLVLDSWVEDGGLPPHIATYDDWMAKREYVNLVPLFPAPLNPHDAVLDRRAFGAGGGVVRAHSGQPAYAALRQALVARYFGGHWPKRQSDPRSFALTAGQVQWAGTDHFGR